MLITALLVLVLDLAFANMNKHGIDRIRNSVVNTTNETTQNTTAEDSTGAVSYTHLDVYKRQK